MTPYYQDAWVTLYHGDCREVVPHLGPVDVCITDPPYNAGKNYGATTNDRMPWPDWCAWWDGGQSVSRSASSTAIWPPAVSPVVMVRWRGWPHRARCCNRRSR